MNNTKILMKKIDKTKRPKHWQKFINKNVVEHNLIIKYGKRAYCTHCHKYFDEDIKLSPYKESKCPRCKKEFYLRNHNIRKFTFITDVAFYVKVDGKIVLRVFEVKSKYNYKTKTFKHTTQEYLRFIPGDGYYINNTLHIYFWNVNVDHYEKIASWRKYRGTKHLYQLAIYPYNKKALYKGTPLQYAPIKELEEKHPYHNSFELLNIANCNSFEYLWKLGLYNLSMNAKYFYRSKKCSFERRFGVPKSFLPFMVENNLNFCQYKILKLLQKTDMNLINTYYYYNYNYLAFMKKQGFLENSEILEKYRYFEDSLRTICKHTSLRKFFNYTLGVENLKIYVDYLEMASKIGYSLKAKDRLFPENLIEAHDQISEEVKILDDIDTQFKVYTRYLELSKYTYEDDKFLIFPAPSVDAFKDEGKQQGNCVATNYIHSYMNRETEIFFIREQKNVTKSLITLEYNNNYVVQKELANHEKNFTEEQLEFIEKWKGHRSFTDLKEKHKKKTKIKIEKYDISGMAA